MKYDARKLSTEEQHLIRKIAAQRVFGGESAAEVSRSLGLGSRTIFPWLRTAREKGIEALSPKIRPGRGRKLSAIEEEEVKRWIIGGDPRQYGFDFGLWTRQIVSNLIFERFKIELSVSSVGTLLHRLGLTPQEPLRRAYERDEKVVNKWVKEVYPKIKSYAKKTGGEKGKTPVVKTSGQRQSINAISALSNRGGFWYHIYSGKFTAEKCVKCFKSFQRGQKRPVILIVDGHPVHKSKKVLEYVDSQDGKLEMVFLPPYAPDLNPDELVWNHMRNIGTSKKPLKKGETLLSRANADLQSIKKNRKLVKSFFQESTVFFAAA
ncbi:IS630 family transposase [Microbulbifer sp. TRSA002]|uniref:IS630 family transposase n=1 Tax=Microbulbifer sp. TRSA002 TaxID=3243382 RepID=UPI00403A7BF4